jgi:F420-0:gamma-glutamyl ligase
MSEATADVMTNTFEAASVEFWPVEVIVTGDANTSLRWGHVECAAGAYGVAAKTFSQVRHDTVGY